MRASGSLLATPPSALPIRVPNRIVWYSRKDEMKVYRYICPVPRKIYTFNHDNWPHAALRLVSSPHSPLIVVRTTLHQKKQQQASKQQEEDASGPGNKVAQNNDRSPDITNKGYRESPQAALRYNGLSDVYLGRLSACPSPPPGLALKQMETQWKIIKKGHNK